MVMDGDHDIKMTIISGREYYTIEHLELAIRNSLIKYSSSNSQLDMRQIDFIEKFINEREAHTYNGHGWRDQTEFAEQCPQLEFMVEMGYSDSGYPQRIWYRGGCQIRIQSQTLQWGPIENVK